MATAQSTIDDLLERVGDGVTARKMFGEYCLYRDGKVVGLVCDDTVFVKPTPAGRELMPDAKDGPPYKGAKPQMIVPPERWEELAALLRATAAALPKPKPKKKRS